MKLNLEAKNKQEEVILAYLQANASDALAEKINNGTPLTKDGKTFTNKKTLSGFMKYACDEARKLAEKGANCACVEDSVVFGRAIHYFEEDSIEGTLYTLDGEIYKPAPKITATRQAPTPVVSPAKPQNVQSSLFDMLTQPSGQSEQADEENQDETEPPTQEDFREAFASMQNTVDEETGEILSYEEMRGFDGDVEEPTDFTATEKTLIQNAEPLRTSEEEKDFAKAFDSEAVCKLYDLLGDCFILV